MDIDVLVLRDRQEDQIAVYPAMHRVYDRFGREAAPQLPGAQEFLDDIASGEAVSKSIRANERIEVMGKAPW